MLLVAAALALLAGIVVTLGTTGLLPWGGAAAPAVLALESQPSSARVLIDGRPRGVTPLQIELAPGGYDIEVGGGDRRERFRLELGAGQHVDKSIALDAAAQGTARLDITTTPPGARVSVNGVARGMSPVQVDGLSPGEHEVVAENQSARVERRVIVGTSVMSLELPLSGFLQVSSPLHVQIHEGGKHLGSSRDRRVEVAAGWRRIELVNEKVGYRETHSIDITAGYTAKLDVRPPDALVHLTADAQVAVTVGGRPMGLTPLRNLPLPLGEHEIVFSSPGRGELRYTVVVSLSAPNRLHAVFASTPRTHQSRQPARRP
jgi:hypothetical protein